MNLFNHVQPLTNLSLSDRYMLFVSIAIGIFLAVLALRVRRNSEFDAIPGPKGYPLIGIGFRLPKNAAPKFRQWAEEYGEVFRIRVGWYNWVVINSPQAVREILEKQAVSTSAKPPSPMGHGVVTGGNRMPTMSYGPRWRALRSAVRRLTSVPITASFIPCQEFEAKQLLFDLLTDNENQRNFYQHMRRFAFSIIMTNTFGTRVRNWDHPDAYNAVKSQSILRRTSRPGAFLVDDFPPLAGLPHWLQPGYREAEEAAAEVLSIKMDLWHRIQTQVKAGDAPHCYAREILETKQQWYNEGLTEENLIWLTSGLVEAGFETTASTLNSLVQRLASDLRVQKEAYEELMRVVGPDRLPQFEDMSNMPYIRACVKEMLRMNPVLSPGIRHFTSKDVHYKDYIIPKGTVLLTNTAFLHFDPERFEQPFQFTPERYLRYPLYSSEYAALSDPLKRDHFTFSTGRRVCPGARLAENSINIALAGILWAFEIRPPLVNGVEEKLILGEASYLDAGFTIPKPFAARFVPRSEHAVELVKARWAIASQEGYELRGGSVDVEGMVQT